MVTQRSLSKRHSGQILDLLVVFELEMPPPDRLPTATQCITTHRRRKIHVHPTVLVHRFTRSKSIAEKRKLHRRIIAGAVDVPAVDNARLLRMQLQPALAKSFRNPAQRKLRLRLARAVDHPIIRSKKLYQSIDELLTDLDT